MRKILKNERGDMSYFSIIIIVAVNMIFSFVLLSASVKIQCINIRNAAKMELNNISARIYANTYHSQREANLSSYNSDLHLSTAFQTSLKNDFVDGMKSRVSLSTNDYTVSGIALSFQEYSDRIEYRMSCNVTFKVQMFGSVFPPIVQHVELTGSHHTKY